MYLVLNLGLKSIRAIVFGDKGGIVVNCSYPLSTILNGDAVEQDGAEWWSKGIKVINDALENANLRKKNKIYNRNRIILLFGPCQYARGTTFKYNYGF